ncbi:hypothetical protein NPIL_245981 [Nephila pilipes]|uniref:Uncharacterized protein n=1 Tax=Nephila pilipes TaxID=299642 RepID=A0A8X6ME74_NEPPI|nr:hypothetical protein NPIL_245981 [Nephila pilipes]
MFGSSSKVKEWTLEQAEKSRKENVEAKQSVTKGKQRENKRSVAKSFPLRKKFLSLNRRYRNPLSMSLGHENRFGRKHPKEDELVGANIINIFR